VSAALPPRNSRRVSDEVFRIIHARIIAGELQPGARIEIDPIAEELDVSRTPVREAVLRLDAAGLVERQPYRGTVVTGVDVGRLAEVTALRIVAEGLAAELGTVRLTDDDLAQMEAILDELDARADDADFALGVFNELNNEFHRVVYAAADAPILLRQIESLQAEADRIRLHFDVSHGYADPLHREILAACTRRDSVAAGKVTRRHILEGCLAVHPRAAEGDGILARVLTDTGMEIDA